MPAIHQFSAGFSNGDAITNEVRVLRGVFQGWGYASDIFSELKRILPELRRETRDIATAAQSIGPEDVVLLHLSIGSPVNEVFRIVNIAASLGRLSGPVGSRLADFYGRCARHPRVGAIIGNDDWGFKTQSMLAPGSSFRCTYSRKAYLCRSSCMVSIMRVMVSEGLPAMPELKKIPCTIFF